jgi:iron-sulfur cluster assembly protein
MATEVADANVAQATPQVHLTQPAAGRILALLAKDGMPAECGGLRLGVQGGGCSGFSYVMRLESQARERDNVFEAFGARIFVDPKSLVYLNGITLDYEETLMRQGFVLQNPNAKRSCGCGSSFSV